MARGRRIKRGRRTLRVRHVRAAGGVLVRPAKRGPKVLLIHRPLYDDWSFPKGKLDQGETFKQAARREVLEETGFSCKTHRPKLRPLMYFDRFRRRKEVRYWLMTVTGGSFVPNSEVDTIAWVRSTKVIDRLTYRRDRELFEEVLASGRIDEVTRQSASIGTAPFG